MALTIHLNGSNFLSDRTKDAFDKAVQDSGRVQRPSPHRGNGRSHMTMDADQGEVDTRRGPTPHEHSLDSGAQLVIPDYQSILESLERGLAQSYDHQRQTLQVHKQYLSNQAEYSKIFSQLMEQQGTLFADGNGSVQRAEATLKVLESLSRSISQFHEHQADTLDVHNQFLSHQAAYAQAFIDLLKQQCRSLIDDRHNGAENGGHGSHAMQPVFDVPVSKVEEPEPRSHVAPLLVETLNQTAPAEEGAVLSLDSETMASSDGDVNALHQSLIEVVSEKTGYPAEMLDLSMDMEADLGIDSIKRVEILGGLQELYPDLPEVDTEALTELRTLGQIVTHMQTEVGTKRRNDASDVVHDEVISVMTLPEPETPESLSQALLEIVSEKTGYPTEMLELDMDMEADLGIDSIKRVEILGALQEQHPDLPEIDAEALTELRTLGQIISYMPQQGPMLKKN